MPVLALVANSFPVILLGNSLNTHDSSIIKREGNN
jgi:hypothetical protein